jgi:hypothetical protein
MQAELIFLAGLGQEMTVRAAAEIILRVNFQPAQLQARFQARPCNKDNAVQFPPAELGNAAGGNLFKLLS